MINLLDHLILAIGSTCTYRVLWVAMFCLGGEPVCLGRGVISSEGRRIYVKSVIPTGANPFPHFSVLISASLLPDYSSGRCRLHVHILFVVQYQRSGPNKYLSAATRSFTDGVRNGAMWIVF